MTARSNPFDIINDVRHLLEVHHHWRPGMAAAIAGDLKDFLARYTRGTGPSPAALARSTAPSHSDPYERAARQAGWTTSTPPGPGFIYDGRKFATWAAALRKGRPIYGAWMDCCIGENIPVAVPPASAAPDDGEALRGALAGLLRLIRDLDEGEHDDAAEIVTAARILAGDPLPANPYFNVAAERLGDAGRLVITVSEGKTGRRWTLPALPAGDAERLAAAITANLAP